MNTAPPPRPRPGRPLRLMLATIKAGGSHVSTANALAQAVREHHAGEAEAEVLEPMPLWGFERLDRRHKASWKAMLENPASIVRSQRIIDRVPRLSVQAHRWLLDGFAREAARRLEAMASGPASDRAPDLVVVNHGWLTVAFTRAQVRYGLRTPVLTFETSTMNANALWADRKAERFVVGSRISKARLARMGVDPARVDVVGYPVRRPFLHAPSKREARAALGLDVARTAPERGGPAAFTVLLLLGGEGVGGDPEAVLGALASLEPAPRVAVVAGRNEALRERLAAWEARLPGLVRLGFVEDLAPWLAAADVVVGKTGPATTYECLAVGRPLVAPSRYGDAENKMIAMLEARGLGGAADGAAGVAEAVRRYRDDPAELARVEAVCRDLDFPGMARRLAAYLVGYARDRRPPADVVAAAAGGLRIFDDVPEIALDFDLDAFGP